MEIKKHEPGMFSWADMPSLDVEKAQAFYTRLLGLEATSTPMGPGMTYVVLNKKGKSCFAMYPVTEAEMKERGGQPYWLSYFTVEDADATSERMKELGGTVMHGPFDVFTAGRMAVAMDPIGAIFAVWQPKEGIGAEVFGEPGALAWNELYTHNTETAAQFYGGLFGWSPNRVNAADGGEYTEFQLNGKSAAGMMAIREEWGEMPANWSVYFAVDDLDASLEVAKGLGAKQITPAMKVEGVGRFSFIQDPQGCYLSIIQIMGDTG